MSEEKPPTNGWDFAKACVVAIAPSVAVVLGVFEYANRTNFERQKHAWTVLHEAVSAREPFQLRASLDAITALNLVKPDDLGFSGKDEFQRALDDVSYLVSKPRDSEFWCVLPENIHSQIIRQSGDPVTYTITNLSKDEKLSCVFQVQDVGSGNWTTPDPVLLKPLEVYSVTTPKLEIGVEGFDGDHSNETNWKIPHGEIIALVHRGE